MNKFLIILSFFSLFTLRVNAQYINLSDDPIEFIDQADSLLKQWGNIGDSTSNNFSAIWNDLNSGDQEKVIKISRTFRERKYKVNPFFIAFYSSLYNALNGEFSNRVNISQWLDVAIPVVENAENGREILRFLLTSRNLFDHGALYYSQYNQLSVPEGSSFTFEYILPSSYMPIIPEEVEQALLEEQTETTEDEFLDDFEESSDDWSDDSWNDDSWDDAASWDTEENLNSFDDDENLDNYGALEEDFDPFASPAPSVDLPVIEGAIIKIENADFEFFSPYDTFQVINVSGTYVYSSRSFVGDTGIVPITIPFGEYETEAEVFLGQFAFNTINPAISAENALLRYDDLIKEDVKGSFDFKSVKPAKSGNKYPVFRSYKSNFEYKNIGEGVKLIGGFTLLGDKINTQGLDLRKTYVEIEKDGQIVFKGHSQRFFVRDTLLRSHKVRVSVYQKQDSLIHPEMGFSYDMSNSFLSLYWEKGNFGKREMLNSYHQVGIIADKMTWDLNTQEINFGIMQGRSEVPAMVRSMNNFDNQEYLQIKGLNNFHPVQAAAYFSLKKDMDEFSFFELAEAYKISPEVMKNAVMTAAGKGYLDFDEMSGLIKISAKTKHAYNSNFKKTDFDNMEWFSVSPSGQNITMFLDSGQMVIRGVDREIISKALKVYYKPDSGIVVLRKNRDFKFDGEIRAGNYSIQGKDFDFNYNSFNMNLTQIDSIRFNLTNDSSGESSERKILGGEVENTGGMFYLNEPDNKSGKKFLPQYPILDVLKPSYVYFDDKDILNGVYDRRVYFEIPQFKLDTLESDNPSVMNVQGTFHTDGVIPDFQTTLSVNPDLSLGFTYQLPEEGFEVFKNDEARFFNEIKMDKKGLHGTGTFNYLTSTTEAKSVTFYQDSMVIENGVINVTAADTEHGDYPDANCADARGVLMASNERYIINSKKRELVNLYNGQAQLQGAAMISKKGMFGIGLVKTKGTDSKSKNFKFSQNSFTARDAEFFIEAEDQDTFALTAHNARLFFDFTENTARLEPEKEGEAVIALPLMAYKTSIPVGTWDLENHTFTMEKPANVDISNSYFYSTLEDQDSLAFNGTYAVYDAIASVLTVKGVPGIYVADAYITPGDSTVIIDESTLIQPLSNASIVMDSREKYHFLNQAEVDIYTRSKFDADATYRYINSGEDTMSIVFEGLFQVPEEEGKRKTDSLTYGESYIEEDANFYVAPKILYQGDVKVFANRPFLEFDGEIRLDLKHSDEFNDWLPFKYSGDPNDIRIELKDEEQLEEDEPLLATGIHVDGGESEMYYTFLSSKRMDEDPDIFRATGLLSMDAESGEFKIGQEDRLSGETKQGNLFIYNDSTSIVNYEGEFNLYGYMPVEIAAHSYGTGRVNIDSGNYTFSTLTYLNYPIPGPAMNVMAKDMSNSTQYVDDLPEAVRSSRKLLFKLSQMIGERAADNYDEQLYNEYIPLYAVSGKFGKSILFSDMDLKWHKKEGALFSGDSAGLSSIGKNDINGRIKTYYEIKKVYESEIVNLFIELLPDCWYYISYDNGRLATFSSNYLYNEIISEKAQSPESGNAQGEAYLASADLYEVTDFIKYYNETYLGRKLQDKDVVLQVTKPDVEDRPIGSKEFGGGDEPKSQSGWGSEQEEDDGGWGTEEEFDDGWGADPEEEIKTEPETPANNDVIESKPVTETKDDTEEDAWGGWGDESETNSIVGAPPAAAKEKKAKEKKVKDKKPKDIPEVIEDRQEDSGWGFGEEVKEDDGGWGFGGNEESTPVIVNDKTEEKKEEKKVIVEENKEEEGWGFGGDDESKPVINDKKADKKKEPKNIVIEDEDDGGWGFGGEDDDVEIVSDTKEKEEEALKAQKEANEKLAEEKRKKEAAEKLRLEEEARKKKEEESKKIVVEDEDDEGGWGFGGDDENVEIVNDKKEKEEAERKLNEERERKLKEEAEQKAKEDARKLKEAEDLKAREEAVKKAKEEAERKAKEEAAKKIVVEEDDDGGWGFGGENEDVQIVNDDKAKEEAEQKAKEDAEKKRLEEDKKKQEDLKAKEEAEKKLKEEEEAKKKKEEADKKAKEESETKPASEGEEDDWDGF